MSETDKPKAKGVAKTIKRINPDNIQSIYVNDMLVSHTDNEFFLVLSQVEPPSVLSEEELTSIPNVSAIAKVKLVVTPAFIEAMVRVLSDNIKRYKEGLKEESV